MSTYLIHLSNIYIHSYIDKNTFFDSQDFLTIWNNDIFRTTPSLEFIASSPLTVGESWVCVSKEIEDTDEIVFDIKSNNEGSDYDWC